MHKMVPVRSSNLSRVALAALTVMCAMVLLPATASAEVKRETLTNAEPTDLVNITPIRLEMEVEPGALTSESVSIFNDSNVTVQLTSAILDLGPPTDKTLLAEPIDDDSYEFGAKDWVTSELTETILQPFEKVTFDVIVKPPLDAPVGSSYAGIEFQFQNVEDAGGTGQVAVRLTTMLQLLLTVPGPVEHKVSLLSATTRDVFHFGRSSFVSYGLRYRNDGTISEHITGNIKITSLFGNQVKKIDLGERALIRGATGTDRAVWTDPPMFGIFSATATIQGDDGVKHTKDMGRVVLLPPWWIIALVLAAILLPFVYFWWRRRQEWKYYLDLEDEDPDEFAAY